MEAMVKTGSTIGKKKSFSLDNETTKEFVSVVDGITFGILEGKAIHAAGSEWTKESKLRWVKLNAAFFRLLANNLERWGSIIEKE